MLKVKLNDAQQILFGIWLVIFLAVIYIVVVQGDFGGYGAGLDKNLVAYGTAFLTVVIITLGVYLLLSSEYEEYQEIKFKEQRFDVERRIKESLVLSNKALEEELVVIKGCKVDLGCGVS